MSSAHPSPPAIGPLAEPGGLADLGEAPVEVSIRELLSGPGDEVALRRLQAYQRKLDIGRKLVQRYADDLGAPMSGEEISPAAYLALAGAFATLAARETSDDEVARAWRLRCVNSAFNCLNRVDDRAPQAARLADLRSRLDLLATEAARCPDC